MDPVNTTVAIDPKIKSKAAARAKQDQLSISVVIRLLLQDYAEGRIRIGTQPVYTENGLTLEQESELFMAEKEAQLGVNVSKEFNNLDEVENHLNSL